jgi:hypothetical protein
MGIAASGTLVISHSIRVGGYELDEAIIRELQEHEHLLIGQEQAEGLKLEIGSALPDARVPSSAEVAGRDILTGLLRRAPVSSETVRAALARPLPQIIAAVTDLLEQTPPQLAADLTTMGLTLVGGGALLPGFDRLLQRETGLTVRIDAQPLTTVARGAGLALNETSRLRPDAESNWTSIARSTPMTTGAFIAIPRASSRPAARTASQLCARVSCGFDRGWKAIYGRPRGDGLRGEARSGPSTPPLLDVSDGAGRRDEGGEAHRLVLASRSVTRRPLCHRLQL